jgi:hypothetical protein
MYRITLSATKEQDNKELSHIFSLDSSLLFCGIDVLIIRCHKILLYRCLGRDYDFGGENEEFFILIGFLLPFPYPVAQASFYCEI